MNIKPTTSVFGINASVMVAAAFVSSAAFISASTSAAAPASTQAEQQSSTQQLNTLIEIALSQDSNRKQYFAQSQAMRETGIASATLMDPKLKVGFGGLPVDSFQFDEDPMTNISVGLMQQFERGNTLDLQQKKAGQQADGLALQVQARELTVANSMTQLWLELGYQQVAEGVMRENRRLLFELENYVQTNYSIGKSEAQDLLNAQLQVSKLDEKLQANQQVQRRLISQLSEWLGSDWLGSQVLDSQGVLNANNQIDWTSLESKLATNRDSTKHYQLLMDHPLVKIIDATISSNQTQVELAEQAYTPQFGVEVMYAHRQANNMAGEPASDLVSAYLTVDIPLFTGNRQDKNLSAAQYQVGAAKSQKDTLLSQMNAQVNALLVDKANLTQRLERYQKTLLPQTAARISAVERGYQNNTAQFNDVISATADELALKLEQQRLITDLNIVNSKLASLVSGFEYQVNQPQLNSSATKHTANQ
ncbi:putative Integral outer membrane protein TolC, efflux pump component [Vibrio crassostreae]|uniref:Putative Integral outer membrane protein TolC, efflux pump component n=1 Tax=Vibrio crassostreae TaxID=246167 RepID=A0A822MVF7_9VIBR|nr:outer membrane protein TolC [Vibrio crassostreae]ROR64195.1 outer membrane protein TolC [Vibrio crassostreae]ROR68710.1 outer membrane protein TolC [Vibrio crassostreae]ROR79442.1 outer membrane protein TolC [Vibrio crassostreae]TCN04521.1 outer membrane protein TolC [Vibrio crassostreae]